MFTFIDMIVFCFVSVTLIKYHGLKQESVWLPVPKRESVWSGQHGRSNRAGPVNPISSARRKPGVQTLSERGEVETHSPPHPTPGTHFLQQNSSS